MSVSTFRESHAESLMDAYPSDESGTNHLNRISSWKQIRLSPKMLNYSLDMGVNGWCDVSTTSLDFCDFCWASTVQSCSSTARARATFLRLRSGGRLRVVPTMRHRGSTKQSRCPCDACMAFMCTFCKLHTCPVWLRCSTCGTGVNLERWGSEKSVWRGWDVIWGQELVELTCWSRLLSSWCLDSVKTFYFESVSLAHPGRISIINNYQ